MEEKCRFEKEIFDIKTDIALIRQSIVGNGQPGLAKRIQTLEEITPRLIYVFMGVGMAVGYAFTFLSKLIRG